MYIHSSFKNISVVMMAVCVAIGTTVAQETEGQNWQAVMKAKFDAMDFEFSRADSDVPFIPVALLSASAYGKSEFQRMDGSGDTVEYRSAYVGGYAMTPLFLGKHGFALAAPYVSRTRFTSMTDGSADTDVDSFYLPVGGIWQAANGKQWGGFAMPIFNSSFSGDGDGGTDFMGGVLGRSFSGQKSIWYYGLVYDYSYGGNFYYPYLGYSYVADPQWVISLVMPWPTVTYAPSDRLYFSVGVLPSGANWVMDQEGSDTKVSSSFGGWDLGTYCGWRLTKLLWVTAGVGFSGLRSLQVDEDGELAFEQNLSREPFVSLSLSARPN